MLMFFLIVLMMLKMLEEICVVEDLMIGWLGLFIVKKKNLTKKIVKIMKKVIIKVIIKKINESWIDENNGIDIVNGN